MSRQESPSQSTDGFTPTPSPSNCALSGWKEGGRGEHQSHYSGRNIRKQKTKVYHEDISECLRQQKTKWGEEKRGVGANVEGEAPAWDVPQAERSGWYGEDITLTGKGWTENQHRSTNHRNTRIELSRSKISRSWGLPYLTGPQVQVVPQMPHDSRL